MDTPYRARPVHFYTISLPFLILGAAAWVFDKGLFWFGVITFLIGVGSALWIGLAGVWQAYIQMLDDKTYDMKVQSQTMVTMARVTDPNVWAAFGYEMFSPEPAYIEEDTKDVPREFLQVSFPKPPASVPQMKLLANDVLRGGSMSEGRWAGRGKVFSGPKYRELMHWGDHPDRKYWVFINPTHPKLGRTPTRKGTEFLLFYADPEVLKLFEKKGAPAVSQLTHPKPQLD